MKQLLHFGQSIGKWQETGRHQDPENQDRSHVGWDLFPDKADQRG